MEPKYRTLRKRNTRTISDIQPNPTGELREITVLISDNLSPLAGVNVVVKGSYRGISSDFNGIAKLRARTGDVLQISYVGLKEQEFMIDSQSSYAITLENDNSDLKEVVVVGYGIQESENKPEDSYSSVKVPAEEILVVKDNVDTELSNALSGEVAGISIENDTTNNITNKTSNFIVNNSGIKTKSWNPDRMYLKALTNVGADKKYALYLELRAVNGSNPSFYFDVATHFYENGDKAKALQVLSNIAELDLENHQLYKSLLYLLREWNENKMALHVAKKIAVWRAHEPQSYRDLALTLEDNHLYQEAFDTLLTALETNYYGEMGGVYEGIEDIILMDINRMISQHKAIKTEKLDKKYSKSMPVAVRVILNWNQMNTDIDLHVIEPTGEECYYSHTSTEIGAKFSKDFTQGYGPEQYLLRNAVKGKYRIKTNYFGETKLTQNGPATVLVEIYIEGKNGTIERSLKTIQLGKVKENEELAVIEIE